MQVLCSYTNDMAPGDLLEQVPQQSLQLPSLCVHWLRQTRTTIKPGEGTQLLKVEFEAMAQPESAAETNFHQRGYFDEDKKFIPCRELDSVKAWGRSEGREKGFNSYFVHGTTPGAAQQIFSDACFKPSTHTEAEEGTGVNVCGRNGVYFLNGATTCEDHDIWAMWDKSKNSQYNKGAIIICKLVGTVIVGNSTTTIRKGVISLNRPGGEYKKVAVAFGRSVRFRKGLGIPVFLGIR